MSIWLNALLFQVGWFACVLSAAANRAWIGLVVAAALIGVHLVRSESPRAEAGLLLSAGVLGFVADTALMRAGGLEFASPNSFFDAAPLWMTALWLLFATTLNHSLAWLRNSPALALAFGALGGPLAYFAGARLGALEAHDPLVYLGVAMIWCIAAPLLLWTAARLHTPPLQARAG